MTRHDETGSVHLWGWPPPDPPPDPPPAPPRPDPPPIPEPIFISASGTVCTPKAGGMPDRLTPGWEPESARNGRLGCWALAWQYPEGEPVYACAALDASQAMRVHLAGRVCVIAAVVAVAAVAAWWIHCHYRDPATQLDDPATVVDDPATVVNEEWVQALEEGRRPEPRRESAWGSVPPFSWMEHLFPTPPALKRGELDVYVTGDPSDPSPQSGPMACDPRPDTWLYWLGWRGWPRP